MQMRLVLVALVSVGLSGCGGGSSSTTPTPTTGEDPLFADQWHLKNTGQLGATGVAAKVGEDINVEPAWTTTKGEGVRIAIVDDGLEIAHEDLAANVAAGQSYNYATGTSDPTPSNAAAHGTMCGGIAAARDLNGLGGKGVAPRASLVGYNLLQSALASDEADAMIRNASSVSVSTNSWGAPDGTGELASSGTAWQTAINTGLSTGRSGLGTLYMWAAGNGREGGDRATCPSWICSDNSNYDGQANYRGVMAVAAVNDQGVQSSYSESGANLWISSPGGEFCSTHTITTTDRSGGIGENPPATAGISDYPNLNYTKCMNGTSAATPGAAGVVALVLAANPSLGWRDVRIILANTARQNDLTGGGWQTNGAGYHFNHKYGFGVVDAAAAVTAAKAYGTNVAIPEKTYTSSLATPGSVITDPTNTVASPAPTLSTITVPAASTTGINSIEWVEVTVTATAPATTVDPNVFYSGDFDITLTSPAATVSHLAEAHNCAGVDGACTSQYSGWVFGSAAHLGETATGNWTLTVKDGVRGGGNGTLNSWQLKFFGH